MKRRQDAIALSLLALLITIFFADALLGIRSFYFRDLVHYYHPAKSLLRQIVLGGEFPYWNPFFHAGQPLAANPEHEIFYPLTWLILLPSFEVGFNLLIVIHLYILAFATYALLRSMRVGPAPSFFGAYSLGMGGLALSCTNLLPILFSLAWLPLTLLFARRFLRDGDRRDFALASFFLGLQLIVGEPTTVAQTGILLGLYAISRSPRLRRVGGVALISIAALFVSAVQTVPTVDHFRDTLRASGLSFDVVSQQSLPPERLAELLYPNVFGQIRAENQKPYWGGALYGRVHVSFFFSIYSGLLITVLAAAGIIARPRNARLALAACAVSLVLALGAHTPLLRFLYDLGLARSTRFPEKFILMAIFTIVVMGAKTLDLLLGGDARVRRTALVVSATVTLLAAGAWVSSFLPAYPALFTALFREAGNAALFDASRSAWMFAVARGLGLILLLAAVTRLRRPLWLLAAGAFILLDLSPLLPDLAPRIPSTFYREPPVAARQFPSNRGEFRIFHYADRMRNSAAGRIYRRQDPDLIWVVRNSLSPMTPAAYGLRTVLEADYDVTSLRWSTEFTQAAWELSVLQPRTWLNTIASMANVWYVGVYENPDTAFARAHGVLRDVQPVRFVEGHHHPRYFFADAIVAIRDRDDFARTLASGRFPARTAFVSEEGRNVSEGWKQPHPGVVRSWTEWTNGARLDVEASDSAFLVMSVTRHKYWRIAIDGNEVQPLVTNLAFQGVFVPRGRHVLTMDYRNPLIPAGGAVTIAALLALVLLARRRAIIPPHRHPTSPSSP